MDNNKPMFHAIMRDKDAPFNCRRLEQNFSLKKGKKTFVVYPGLACKSEEQANGMLKILEKELGDAADKCNLICLYYPDLKKEMTRQEKRLSAEQTAEMTFSRFLTPLISQTDENGNMKRISPNLAAAAASNLNFYTHCYGSYIMEAHEKQLAKLLPELGYLPAEADYISKQIVAFHHNNISEYMGEKETLMSHIERLTKSDKKREERTYQPGSFQDFIKNEQLADDEVLCVALNKNEYALLVNRLTVEGGNEHNGGQWEENKTPAGQKEQDIIRGVMRERVISNRCIKDIPDLIYFAHEDKLMNISYDDLNDVMGYGEEMSEDYHYHKQKAGLNQTFINKNCGKSL